MMSPVLGVHVARPSRPHTRGHCGLRLRSIAFAGVLPAVLVGLIVFGASAISVTWVASPALAATSGRSGSGPVCTGHTQVPSRPRKILGVVQAASVRDPLGRCGAGVSPAAAPSFNGTPPLLFHGGPVMGTPSTTGEVTMTPIYWAPAGYSFPTSYMSTINGYISNVAADSGKTTNVFSTGAQYTNGTKHIKYTIHAGVPLADANPYPTTATCTPDSGAIYQDNSGYTACIADQRLQSEVQSFLTAHSLPNDLAHLYLVFLPKAAESCFSTLNGSLGGECSLNPSSAAIGGFCGYHSFSGIYASMPFPIYNSPIGFTCSPQVSGGPGNQSPNGNLDADVEISVASHEMAESITDPTGGGWYDSSGISGEIGDDCNFVYGSGFGGSAGAFYNQIINGAHYFTQEEFSNENFNTNSATSCIQREESPAAIFAVTTGSPTVGIPVSFNGASSNDPDLTHGVASYSWNFGDSSAPGTGATPNHTYASAGSFTVVLTVTDIDGWQATVSHQITISVVTPGTFRSLPPSRLLDTRNGIGAPKLAVVAHGTVHLQVTGRGGVPASGVSAVVLNVTAVTPTSGGYLTVYGTGSARPGVSSLNFVAGQTVPNLVIAPVGTGGKVDLYNGSSGTIQILADVSGYYLN